MAIFYNLYIMDKIDFSAVVLIESKLDYYRHSFAEGLISKETYEKLNKRYSEMLRTLKGM